MIKVALKIIASFFLAVIFMSLAYDVDLGESKVEYDKYCELVSLWERDEDQGLSEHDRAGHPNYKGVVCEQ